MPSKLEFSSRFPSFWFPSIALSQCPACRWFSYFAFLLKRKKERTPSLPASPTPTFVLQTSLLLELPLPLSILACLCFPGLCHHISLHMFAFLSLRRIACLVILNWLIKITPPLVVLNLNPLGRNALGLEKTRSGSIAAITPYASASRTPTT